MIKIGLILLVVLWLVNSPSPGLAIALVGIAVAYGIKGLLSPFQERDIRSAPQDAQPVLRCWSWVVAFVAGALVALVFYLFYIIR